MDRTEWFLALIAYLLTMVVLEIDSGTTPMPIALFALFVLYGLPVYLLIHILVHHVIGGDEAATTQ